MQRFNLIDEPWIPVRFCDGRRAELGLRETLLRAQDIAGIEDPSPLVVGGLHRLLLAVLYRALEGPSDHDQSRALLADGFSCVRIVRYLEDWQARFWLFHETHPFAQNPEVPAERRQPWTKLTAEHNAAENKVLFDHTDVNNPGVCPDAACARWLVATLTFSVSGGSGYFTSPSAGGLHCLPLGRTLHETLCYNLVPQAPAVLAADTPIWERDPLPLPLAEKRRDIRGYCDLYTWPARMLLLEPEAEGVAFMRFIPGQGYAGEEDVRFLDPMLPYRKHPEKGYRPVPLSDRGVWRDFDSLLPGGDGAPATVQHALAVANRRPERMPRAVMVLGLKNTPPRTDVEFWRLEIHALPQALLGQDCVRAEIRELLKDAETAEKALKKAAKKFAQHSLSRGERKPDEADVTKLVDQLDLSAAYWSRLAPAFDDCLRGYRLDSDFEDIRQDWVARVRATLDQVWSQHAALCTDAHALRALLIAEKPVRRALRELNTTPTDKETA